MSTAEQNKLKLAYEGSVKRVWESSTDDTLLFGFTDDYSIFDWGKMPETIENKGRALAVFGAFFFEYLAKPETWSALAESDFTQLNKEYVQRLFATKTFQELKAKGLHSHFTGLVNDAGEKLTLNRAASSCEDVYMRVKKAAVQRPQVMLALGQNIFHYPAVDQTLSSRLVPLEVVFRFGMPQGSSLKERLAKDPSYASVLGLSQVPTEGKFFDRPVLEFYTKLEPKDRLLSLQEAVLMSGLSAPQMLELIDKAQLIALAIFALFGKRGIELWDGKFEFIVADGEILLADSIGPDELRLLYKGTHLSKEMIRQVYRDSHWEKSLKQAQKLAKERASLDWKQICIDELKALPEPFEPEVKKVINRLYGTLTNHVSQEENFKEHPDLDAFVESVGLAKLGAPRVKSPPDPS